MITAVLMASWLTITATRPINSKDLEIPHDFGPPTDKDIALLLSYADNPDRRIRSDAAWALGDSTLSRVNPDLARRLSAEGNDAVRADLLMAMGKLPDQRDPAAVMNALNDKTAAARCFALWTLGQWAAKDTVSAVVERATKDESEPVRMAAATTLGRLDMPQALEGLTRAMSDKSPRVRQSAATAMGRFKVQTEDSLKALLHSLQDADPLVRAAAVGALGSVANFPVEAPVAEMAGDQHAFVRKQVAAALRALDARGRVQTTIGLLHDSDMTVRIEAAATLGAFRSPDAIVPLISRMDDPEKFVRRAAAKGLVGLQLTNEALPKLVGQLANESAPARREAAWALGEYRDKRATSGLCKAVGDSDKEAALNTIEALGKIADPDAVDTLLQQLRNEMAEKRAMAAWSLGEIRDKRATAALIPVLTDPDFPPRLEAATAAGKINDASFVQPLIAVLQNVSSEQFQTRAAAAWSLGRIGDARAVVRLKQMLADKVIPTPFGPVYDHDSVRMNSAVALARIARALPNAGQLPPITSFLEDQFAKSPDLSDTLKECVAECLYVLTGKQHPFERRPPGPRQYFVRSIEGKN
jgi:HEAT repeat protein